MTDGAGVILLTVGSKTVDTYARAARDAGVRLVARVLPTPESLAACAGAGLEPRDIVAHAGPDERRAGRGPAAPSRRRRARDQGERRRRRARREAARRGAGRRDGGRRRATGGARPATTAAAATLRPTCSRGWRSCRPRLRRTAPDWLADAGRRRESPEAAGADSCRRACCRSTPATARARRRAAVGQALRARGAGLAVAFVQFVKGGRESSELTPLRAAGVRVERPAVARSGLLRGAAPRREDRAAAAAAWAAARAALADDVVRPRRARRAARRAAARARRAGRGPRRDLRAPRPPGGRHHRPRRSRGAARRGRPHHRDDGRPPPVSRRPRPQRSGALCRTHPAAAPARSCASAPARTPARACSPRRSAASTRAAATRVAPFKAQNMALNSFVTPDGGEIGRAQAYQARAAGVEPHVDMNPVLLKPSSQTGSQVIVLGRPVRHMAVREYHAYQPEVWPTVDGRLRAPARGQRPHRHRGRRQPGRDQPARSGHRQHEGGPVRALPGAARRRHRPRRRVRQPGRHMELFTPEERELVAAFVINKFRGDATLLDSGIDFLRERTGVPTLGVVPMLTEWRGDEEDSLGIEDRRRARGARRAAADRRRAAAVHQQLHGLRRARRRARRERALRDARRRSSRAPRRSCCPAPRARSPTWSGCAPSGMATALQAAAAAGTPLIGVCGGYQMLGRRIARPRPRRVGRGRRRRPRPARRARPPSPATNARCASRANCSARRRRQPLGPPPGAVSALRARGCAATRSTWAAPPWAAAPRRCCVYAAPTGALTTTAPRAPTDWSAAATCTASSTTRSCARPSSTACARRAACHLARARHPRPTTTSTASPTTSRRTSTPTCWPPSSDWRRDEHGSWPRRHRVSGRRRPRRSRTADAPRRRRPLARRRRRLRPARRRLDARPGSARRRAHLRGQAGRRPRGAAAAHQRAAQRARAAGQVRRSPQGRRPVRLRSWR